MEINDWRWGQPQPLHYRAIGTTQPVPEEYSS